MAQQTQAWLQPGAVNLDRTTGAGESKIAVDVTFLRLAAPAAGAAPALPGHAHTMHVPRPTVGFYRYLYGLVGHDYCWWLRRAASDAELAGLLSDPRVSLHVLYEAGEPGGFFELDERLGPQMGGDINIGYFGLMPHLIGRGYGRPFLRRTVDEAWRRVGMRPGCGVRVNTCTADHPRALDTYLWAGFRPLRTVREVWSIPDRLGLPIPPRLRV